jgi:hypothetical protein
MIFNVRQFGAMGDGHEDDTVAVQKAINAASQEVGPPTDQWGKGGTVFFPAGKYIISDELEIKQQSGLRFVGEGAMYRDERTLPPGDALGPRTSLYWAGATGEDKAMLTVLGSSVTIEDIAFYGGEDHEEIEDVTLIRFESESAGYPTAGCTLRNVTLAGATVGIEMGPAGTQATGCDTTIFERVSMQSLDVGFKTGFEQAVGFVWTMLRAENCRKVLDFSTQGGLVEVNLAEIINCGGDGSDDYPFDFGPGGVNLRCSRLNCVRVTGEQPKILRIKGDHRVAVDSLTDDRDVGTDPGPAFHLESGGALTFHACSFGVIPVLSWQDTASTVRFRDCWFNLVITSDPPEIDPSDIIDSPGTTDCFYSFEKCDGVNNMPFLDVRTAW